MKKTMLAAGFSSFLLLAACNATDTDNAAEDALYDDEANTINISDRYDTNNEDQQTARDGRVINNNDTDENNFGYVRHQKSPTQGETVSYRDIYTMDRERTADAIARLIVGLPTVNDSSVVVTDEEVLVAYTKEENANADGEGIADQVKRTALSVVPRWYHVYLTDDPNLRREVENIAQLNGDAGAAEDTIDRTVKLMKERSPQGSDEAQLIESERNDDPTGERAKNAGNQPTDGTNKEGQKTGMPGTTGTPGTNWTTGPTDQDSLTELNGINGNTNR
ncbi:YhcN/YlaJ family sporulation lipoprotein [Bacillus thermotolerans]|uniref:YhcN/YlaJ family sporulation lipoprotein n=1 Tax=Bacillus thermotolerans TaxID=1221996 RepID=UPI000591EE28|nr:YhcN/YlaJ family sporulation lipoprotein [Bacillus thermotolerans]KKB44420.1 Phosphonate ABC transporter phosphate-binding periplasmic component [Bacillus thermotolerans]